MSNNESKRKRSKGSDSSAAYSLVLKGKLGSQKAKEVLELFRLKLAESPSGVDVDLSQVTAIGCACAQVLLSAHKTAVRDGIPLRFSQWSRPAEEDWSALGLTRSLLDSAAGRDLVAPEVAT